MSTDTVIRARIDSDTKARAAEALRAMGLSISDAVRLLMVRIAEEQRLPFALYVPNATTLAAMDELNADNGTRFDSPENLFEDLGI